MCYPLSLSVPHNKVFRLNMSEADGERESDLTLELLLGASRSRAGPTLI